MYFESVFFVEAKLSFFFYRIRYNFCNKNATQSNKLNVHNTLFAGVIHRPIISARHEHNTQP